MSKLVQAWVLLTALFAGSPLWAQQYEFRHSIRGATTGLGAGDSVVVDVFLDADPGLVLFSISVDVDAGILSYDPVGSLALPVIYYAPYYTNGSHPDYLLYVDGFSGWLNAFSSPFISWPTPPPGREQVNIDFESSNFPLSGGGSGTDVWIASLLFDVDVDFASTEIGLSADNGGNTVVADGTFTTTFSAPIKLVPEPAVVALLLPGAGALLGLQRLRLRRGRATARRSCQGT